MDNPEYPAWAEKRIAELEAQLTALREAARDQLPDVSMRSDVHDKLAALLENK